MFKGFQLPEYLVIAGHKVKLRDIVIGIGSLGLLALAVHQKWLDPELVKQADRIIMRLDPPELIPGKPAVLSGRFENKNGDPVRVKMGKYMVVKEGSPGQPEQVMTGGFIGPLASEFQVTIDTRGFPPGKYQILVEDRV